jgi:hypothetical protein
MRIHLEAHDKGEWEEAMKLMKGQSFRCTYWKSTVPPDFYEISVTGLTDVGKENWKNLIHKTPMFIQYPFFLEFMEWDDHE